MKGRDAQRPPRRRRGDDVVRRRRGIRWTPSRRARATLRVLCLSVNGHHPSGGEAQGGVDMNAFHALSRAATSALLAAALALPGPAHGLEIRFRSFSGSATMGPMADAYAAKLLDVSRTVIGPAGEIKLTKISPTPAVPGTFADIVAAVGA